MNLLLAILILAEAAFALIAWLSPHWLCHFAAILRTRADVIRAAEIARKESMKHWKRELALPKDEVPKTVSYDSSAYGNTLEGFRKGRD